MWQFIVHFQVPSISFLYAMEPYGEGLFSTVSNLASTANQAFRINGVGIKYMPGTYDLELARTQVQVAKKIGSKFVFLAMTTDQTTYLSYILEQEGLFTKDWQLIGSEAVKMGAGEPRASGGLPVGFLRFRNLRALRLRQAVWERASRS